MFKELSLDCIVVGSSLIRKKEKLAKMTTRCHLFYHSLSFAVTCCHSLSLVVTRCVTRLPFYKRSITTEDIKNKDLLAKKTSTRRFNLYTS